MSKLTRLAARLARVEAELQRLRERLDRERQPINAVSDKYLSQAAAALGRHGGRALAATLSPDEQSAKMRKAVQARWARYYAAETRTRATSPSAKRGKD